MDKVIVKVLFIIAVSFLLANQVLSQQQLEHQIKYYVAEDGKLYWNKKLPVYIRITPTPADSGVLMKSENTKDYTNPYYFDTEGINRIRSRWATNQETGATIYPQFEVIWEVYADGIPPESKLVFSNSANYKKGANDFYGDKVTIKIVSTDEVSGVEQIYYSINGEAYKPYTSELKIDREGAQFIKYYAVDNVGNVETPKEKRFTADITPPKTYYTITGIAEGEIVAVTTKIYLSAEDSLSGVADIYYKIDDGKETVYTAGSFVPIAQLSDGNHKLAIYSVDKVGNKEVETIIPFYLDKTAPIVAADILGDRYLMGDKIFFSGRTKMKLTAVDNKAGVENILYSVNGSEFTSYDQPFYLPNVPGIHIVKYFATDKVQNNSEGGTSKFEKYKHVVSRVYVDLTGPILRHSISGPQYKSRDTLFISNKTKIILNAIDAESGLQYISYGVNDEAEEIKYTDPVQLQEDGFKHIVYYAYDNVNNRNRDEFFVFVDKTGPEIKYNFSIVPQGFKENLPVYPDHVILFLGATDMKIGAKDIYYSINKGPEKKYSSYITGFKKASVNTINIKAKDFLANETHLELSIYIE